MPRRYRREFPLMLGAPLSMRRPIAFAGKRRRVERFGRASVAHRLFVGIVDQAPENALGTHLPLLRVPRVLAFRRLAGERSDVFAARAKRDGGRRRGNVEAEFPSRFAKVQVWDTLGLALGILFRPHITEKCIRHLAPRRKLQQRQTPL